MIPLKNNPNVDNNDLLNYPDGRIKDNDGSGNGTGVNRSVYGDLHSNISKLMRLYDIISTGLPDNETSGYQIIEALSALASKNDYIYPLTTNGTTTLSIDIKLSLMKNNEFLICLASANKGTETLIKGSGVTSMAVTYSGNFKANEYVRVIKTSGGVSIIRIADWNSLNTMCTELLFLKKASQAEEDAGIIETVATTPKSNKAAFIKRVNGADSATYLATALQHGLYPKEHWIIVNALGASPTKNIGSFSVSDISSGYVGTLPKDGDITSATATYSGGGYVVIRCVVPNDMGSSNYEVQLALESQGVMSADNTLAAPVYKIINSTTFDVSLREVSSTAQNIKVRLRTIKV